MKLMSSIFILSMVAGLSACSEGPGGATNEGPGPVEVIRDHKVFSSDLAGKPADFSGHWNSESCTVGAAGQSFPCVLDFAIDQSDSVSVSGQLSVGGSAKLFYLPYLKISANDLVDPLKGLAPRGKIGQGAVVIDASAQYGKFVAKLLPDGKLAFLSVDPNGSTVDGIAKKGR